MPELGGDLLNDDAGGESGCARRLDINVATGVLLGHLAFEIECCPT